MCVCVCVFIKRAVKLEETVLLINCFILYIYIYIYMCVCVCVFIKRAVKLEETVLLINNKNKLEL